MPPNINRIVISTKNYIAKVKICKCFNFWYNNDYNKILF